MENIKLKIERDLVVTQEDIDCIMTGVLEGGITYWCSEANVVGRYLGEYASEQISRGGEIELYDTEEETYRTLNLEKLLKGLKMYLENPHPYDILEEIKNELRIDTCEVDEVVCDMIIQYALFDEIVYS